MTPPQKFLIVDDEPYARQSLVTHISKLVPTAKFIHAGDGSEALEALGKHVDDLDLVTLDINMPGRNGRDFLVAKKANPTFERVKVLIVSTEESKFSFDELKTLGADGFCEKPVTTDKLAEAFMNLFGLNLSLSAGVGAEASFLLSRFEQQLGTLHLRDERGRKKTASDIREEILRMLREDISQHEKSTRDLLHFLDAVEAMTGQWSSGDDGERCIAQMLDFIHRWSAGISDQTTDIKYTLAALGDVQNCFARLATLVSEQGGRAEILSLWNDVFQKLHNVKGQVEPPLLRGIFKFVNTELMNLARDFSQRGGARISEETANALIDIVDWLICVVKVEKTLHALRNVRKTIGGPTPEERERIRTILQKLDDPGLDPDGVEESVAIEGLIAALRSDLSVIKVVTQNLSFREAKSFDDLALRYNMVKSNYQRTYPPRDPDESGKRYGYILFAEVETEADVKRVFGDLVDDVAILHRGHHRTAVVRSRLPQAQMSIPVSMKALEHIYRDVERLSLNKSRIYEIRQSFERNIEPRLALQELDESIKTLEQATQDIQDQLLKIRLVPLQDLFDSVAHHLAELNSRREQPIHLVMSGGKEQLDKKVTDELREVFNVFVDNACLHAFDSQTQGTLRLHAESKEGNVIITIRDDGKGLNANAIKQKAIQKGILKEGKEYSSEEIYNCIFTKGFSTAETESELGGKGIGMYTVKRMVEKFFGKITVQSQEQKGTTFTLEFPNTISIDQGLLVRERGLPYIVSLKFVQGIKSVRGGDIQHMLGGFYFWEVERHALGMDSEHGRVILPIIRLSQFLNLEEQPTPLESETEYTLIVLRQGAELIGVFVESIERKEDIVLKHIGEHLRAMQVASDGVFPYQTYTVLGDGTLVPVLNIHAILSRVRRAREQMEGEREQQQVSPPARKETSFPDAFGFEVGNERFAVDLKYVRRSYVWDSLLRDLRKDAELSARLPYIEGVVLRGSESFPVVDGGRLLGIPSGPCDEVIVIEARHGRFVGMLVSGCVGILPGTDFEKAEFVSSDGGARYTYLVRRGETTSVGYKEFDLSVLEHVCTESVASEQLSGDVAQAVMGLESVRPEAYLLLRLADWLCALPASSILTVRSFSDGAHPAGSPHPWRFPRLVEYVEGLFNIVGRATPFIHLKKRLGIAPPDGSEKSAIVVHLGHGTDGDEGELCGLIVDEVLRTLFPEDFEIVPHAEIPAALDPHCVRQVGRLRAAHSAEQARSGANAEDETTQLFFVLNLDAILDAITTENVAL